MKDKICIICGTEIKNAYGQTKYCPTCREIARLETIHKWQHAQKKPTQTIKCVRCGKDMLKIGNVKKYCDGCRADANREQARKYEADKASGKRSLAVTQKHNTPLKGEYREQAFYPFVTVTQSKVALTYNEIKQLANAKGVSYAEQAKVMGL